MKEVEDRLQEVLNAVVAQGRERGVQLAAYLEGELVVDIAAGTADPGKTRMVTQDTLFPIFSVGKGITSTIIHRLVEQGKLDYDQRIAHYWPEFGVNGKDGITIRQALNHSAGIPQMPTGLTLKEMCDWDTICGAVAALVPLWEPGTMQEYHAITFGWILGEAACRADGRPFPQLVREEVCEIIGTPDIYIGLPAEAEPRVAELEEYNRPPTAPLPDNARPLSIPVWLGPLHAMMNRSDVRRACSPGTNGIMSARAVARHYAALLPGGVDGVSLLTPERLAEATTLQPPANPAPNTPRLNKGLGYNLFFDEAGKLIRFGHGGYGGSDAYAEPAHRFAVCITKNLFSEDGAKDLIINELRSALKLP